MLGDRNGVAAGLADANLRRPDGAGRKLLSGADLNALGVVDEEGQSMNVTVGVGRDDLRVA